MSLLSGALSLGIGLASGQLPYPLINGFAFSYASAEAKFALPNGLKIVKGWKSISYKAPRERGKLWGSHPAPYAKTIGKQDYEAEGELYLAEAVDLQNALGPGFGDVFFDLHVTYTTPGYPMIEDIITGCTLDSPEQGMQAGSPEGLTRKFTFNPLGMTLDQNSILSSPLSGLIGSALSVLGI